MTVVSDSGPLIHLSIVGQFPLLKRYFNKLLIIPQVYNEVVTQGKGKPGDSELCQAVKEGWIAVESLTDHALVQRLNKPNISETDAAVVAFAIEKKAGLVLADDSHVRGLVEQEGISVMGSIGIFIHARIEGQIIELKPILDQLVAAGFHLDPDGRVYKDALKRVGEIPFL
jgi:predicted nucleic acid-binding protein